MKKRLSPGMNFGGGGGCSPLAFAASALIFHVVLSLLPVSRDAMKSCLIPLLRVGSTSDGLARYQCSR